MTAALVGLSFGIFALAATAVGLALAYRAESLAAAKLAAKLERATLGLTTERAAHVDSVTRLEAVIASLKADIAQLESEFNLADPAVATRRLRRLFGGPEEGAAPAGAQPGVPAGSDAGVEEGTGDIHGAR